MERFGEVTRTTNETDISIRLVLNGSGQVNVNSGIGFFDHMLTLLGAHGRMDLSIQAAGDLKVDGHHTVEDIGIALGQSLKMAIGDKRGIERYATVIIPMDEALCMVSLDLSGRPYLYLEMPTLPPMVGDFDTQLLEEFLRAFSVHGGITLHVRVLYGRNGHHMIEAVFKALGRALKQATAQNGNMDIPSTKGTLD